MIDDGRGERLVRGVSDAVGRERQRSLPSQNPLIAHFLCLRSEWKQLIDSVLIADLRFLGLMLSCLYVLFTHFKYIEYWNVFFLLCQQHVDPLTGLGDLT